MNMMKRFPAVALLAVAALAASAQAPNYDDLLFDYVDGKYEDCVRRAERYMDKEATKRDPLPYLYASKCYHEMSKSERFTQDPEYKYAARDALKYAVKYRKKDKALVHFAFHEEFWSELSTSAYQTGIYYLDNKDYSKAKRQFDRIVGYDPANAGAWQLLALVQMRMNLQRDAVISLQRYDEALAAIEDVQKLPKDQQVLLRESMVRHAEFCMEKGDRTRARAILAKGKDEFMGNAEFRSLFESLG